MFSTNDYRIYLLGNPVIWWLVLATFTLYLFYFFVFEIRSQRGYTMTPHIKAKSHLVVRTCAWLILGWAMHYFPFYLMGRVLYFHHYFPAYLISAMVSGIVLEHLVHLFSLCFTQRGALENVVYNCCVGLLLCVAGASFYNFRGLSYGMHGHGGDHPNATYAAHKWLDTWEF